MKPETKVPSAMFQSTNGVEINFEKVQYGNA